MKDDALYLEADEDITSAIDKLHKSAASSVQIVVPKRSSMLQSIINLKLLKKAAEQGGKELVLVTNDRIATELAGRVGLAVAPSLGAKAVVAAATIPAELKTAEEVIDEDDPVAADSPPTEAETAAPKSKRPAFFKRKSVSDGPPVPPPPPEPEPQSDDGPVAPKPPKVPNFGRLQKRALWVGFAVFLVAGYLVVMYIFGSAKVTLYANGSRVDIDTTFAVDPSAKTSDTANAVLAGQTVTLSKDLSGPFTPTGKQDAGTKAIGTITIGNCLDSNTHLFVAGTRFTSPDGKIFRSTADVSVPGGTGSFFGCSKPGTATVSVQADQNGDAYNEAPASYNIPGLPASQTSGSALCPQCKITAAGAQMSGGVTKTVLVVVQPDVDTAQTGLLAKDQDNATRGLAAKVPNGYTALTSSEASSVSNVSPSPAVGAQGATGNLQIHVTYTEIAVKTSDYQSLVEAQEQKQIGSGNQVYDNGLSTAQVTSTAKDSSGRPTFHLTTEAYSGTKLDTAQIAAKLKNQKYGDATTYAQGLPGVSQVSISIWPTWAGSLPARADKISVIIKVAKQ